MPRRIINNTTYSIKYDSFEHETENAYKVIIEDAEIWFPKSEIVLEESTSTIELPGWLITQKEDEHNIELF